MLQTNLEYSKGPFLISNDKSRLDLNLIHDFLANQSYWAKNIPMTIVQKAIENSLCFGVYQGEKQVGFARVISDFATYAYLADVFILEESRGQGLSKWLVECIKAHPDLQGLRNFMLATRDAHELYRQYGGFESLKSPERWMQITDPDIYSRQRQA